MSEHFSNPVLGFEGPRLKALIFELIGASAISTIRLPNETSSFQLRGRRQLFLRLGWIFEALHFSPNNATPVIDGPTTLRILLLLLKTCSSKEVTDAQGGSSRVYGAWRRVALASIVAVTRMLLVSNSEFGIDEKYLVAEELQKIGTAWGECDKFECLLLEKIIPRSVTLHYKTRPTNPSPEAERKALLADISCSTLLDGFWYLYDWICEECSSAGTRRRVDPVTNIPSDIDPQTVFKPLHKVLQNKDVLITFGSEDPDNLAHYELERLMPLFGMNFTGLLRNQDSEMISEILDHESGEFRRTLSPSEETPISILPQEVCSSRMTAGTNIEDSTDKVAVNPHGSPINSKLSVESIPRRTGHPEHNTFQAPNGSHPFQAQNNNTVNHLEPSSFQVPIVSDPLQAQCKEQGTEQGAKFLPSTSASPHRYTEESSASAAYCAAAPNKAPQRISTAPSIRTAGFHLSVSTWNPAHNSATQRYGTETAELPPPRATRMTLPPSGLEVIGDPPTPPPKPTPNTSNTHQITDRGANEPNNSNYSLQTARSELSQDRRRSSTTNHRRDSAATDAELGIYPPSTSSSSVHSHSHKKRSLLGLLTRSTKPVQETLPSSLKFEFSSCGMHIILWHSDPQYIVQITHPFNSGPRIPLIMPSDASSTKGKEPQRSIRFLAANGSAIVGVVHVDNSRWLYHLHTGKFQPLLQLDRSTPNILALSLSPDGTIIALGCGKSIQTYRISNGQLNGIRELPCPRDFGNQGIRYHKLNFSVNSQRLVSAVQVDAGAYKCNVYTSIWGWSGYEILLESNLDPMRFDMVDGADKGISSISVFNNSGTRGAFLTAILSRPYRSILPIAAGAPSISLENLDNRISSCAQAPCSETSHLFAIRSGPNKIFRIDARTGTTELAADFSAERKGIDPRQECIALSIPAPDTIRALWRTGKSGLVLKTCVLTGTRWTVNSSVDLGPVYRRIVAGVTTSYDL